MTIEEFNKFKVGDRIYDSVEYIHRGDKTEEIEIKPNEDEYIIIRGEYNKDHNGWLGYLVKGCDRIIIEGYILLDGLKYRYYKKMPEITKKMLEAEKTYSIYSLDEKET